MCDSGELCEARMAMLKSDKETVTNGMGENQEVNTVITAQSCLFH